MIGEGLDGVTGSFKVMAPVSHAFDNGKKFPVIDVVIALRGGALTRIKGYRVPLQIVELAYNARNRKSGGISM